MMHKASATALKLELLIFIKAVLVFPLPSRTDGAQRRQVPVKGLERWRKKASIAGG